jgi:hypothetical protein
VAGSASAGAGRLIALFLLFCERKQKGKTIPAAELIKRLRLGLRALPLRHEDDVAIVAVVGDWLNRGAASFKSSSQMLVMWKLRLLEETRGTSQLLLFYRKMRREMLTELSFEGDDYYQLFDLLIDAAGKEWLESPTIMLDGQRRSLHSAAAMISKELGYQRDLLGRHQEKSIHSSQRSSAVTAGRRTI